MYKNYNVKPAADTPTDLIPALSEKTAIIANIEISVPTAATITIKRHDGTNDYQVQSFSVNFAPDIIVLDHKIVLPAGHKMVVVSDQADTEFTANVKEA